MVNALSVKHFALREFGNASYSHHPNPAEGRYRDRHDTRDGTWWTPTASARLVFAGRATVSESVARTTGAVSVRQNRVVLAPGVCAPSLAVMGVAQPGPRISHRQGDGGNSASLPGESSA
nr:hypothetical protein [Bradyrhizobium sp. Oc8]